METNFLNKFKLIWVVQSPAQKYICFPHPQITSISLAVSFQMRAFRDRQTRGMRCGGRGQRRACEGWQGGLLSVVYLSTRTNGVEAYGEIAWSWRPKLASSLAEVVFGSTGSDKTVDARRR